MTSNWSCLRQKDGRQGIIKFKSRVLPDKHRKRKMTDLVGHCDSITKSAIVLMYTAKGN